MPHNVLLLLLNNEFVKHFETYHKFSSTSKPQQRKLFINYFTNKTYINDFCDILPLVACNALGLRIIIMSSQMQRLCDCAIVKPNLIPSANDKNFPYIALHLRNEHFICLLSHSLLTIDRLECLELRDRQRQHLQ